MQKEVEAIEVLFNNVEFIVIPSALVKDVKMGAVREEQFWNETYSVMDNLTLTIDKTFASTEGLFMVENAKGGISPDMHPLSRMLFFKDMVAVTLHFSDKTTETIYCPWTEVDGYDDFNASQEAFLTPEGHVVVRMAEVVRKK
jgi:hypothetical protein